jgi:Leucine-rich repeat (LRR) protein
MGVPPTSVQSLLVSEVTGGGVDDRALNSTHPAGGLFSSLRNVTHLTVRNAGMRRVPDNFLEDFPALTVLDLSDNGIEQVSKDMLSHVPELKSLNLWNNVLTEIPRSFFDHAENLEKLYLNGNLLKNLTGDVFKVSCDTY